MKVSEVMTKEVASVSEETTLKVALDIMLRMNMRRLLVRNGKLTGILTIRDIVYNGDLNKKVGDVASKDVQFVMPTATLKEACRIMTSQALGSLLVGDGVEVEGIVTERDLIRYCKPPSSNVGDVMNIDPIIAGKDATIKEIVDFMKKKWVRHAVIVEDSLPVGIISVRDISRAMLSKGSLEVKVEGFMTVSPFKVTPDSTLETARRIMVEHNIGFLPVVDPRTLLGSLSEREMIAAMSL
ncbi:CBS domain-containing protein [Sulfuracidifex tepidarius]|uniref:Methylated protein n=1 Tax=Sulfuracidifex tepidarius TaxID=1294262 RepID=A0A510DS13_9CREN|nr:CBS domain-containing protein [Sulfuracidifex tepidarius]BBG22969.1 Methylated protein [Sulfuracidifex tepidarius]BBG25730.1 Methylated protein [Sulfuracidifex tepidarius]